MSDSSTQVVIIGGGPSGLLLSQLLHVRGINSVVLERKTKDYVLSRIRAGVLERGLLSLMREAGVSERMESEGLAHDGTLISYGDQMFRVDFKEHTGNSVMVYGQTEVTRDLYEAREKTGGKIEFNVEDVEIHDAKTDAPFVTLYTGWDQPSNQLRFRGGLRWVSRGQPQNHPTGPAQGI